MVAKLRAFGIIGSIKETAAPSERF